MFKFIEAEEIYRVPGARSGLPAWAYHNAELTHLEMEQLFLRNWMFVAHVSDIPRGGDYRCFELGDERAVVVRGEDAAVRAFHNQCRHRASRVVADDRGHCGKAMICPFHGWSYNLDGTLKNIPKRDSFPDIDADEFGLKPLDEVGCAANLATQVPASRNAILSLLHPIEAGILVRKHDRRLLKLQRSGRRCWWRTRFG